jgi:hypothetical protein
MPGSMASAARPRLRMQFSLRGVLLLTALIAVWGTHFLNQRSIEQLQSRVVVLRQMAAELIVANPNLISVVKQPDRWYDEQKWEVYLPSEGYQLCLATEEVEERGLAPSDQQISLPQGRVRLELIKIPTDGGWQVIVLQDDQPVLTTNKPKTWDSGIGSAGGGNFSQQQEFQPDDPVVLMRRRFMVSTGPHSSQTPQGPAAGVLLWIEKPVAAGSANTP